MLKQDPLVKTYSARMFSYSIAIRGDSFMRGSVPLTKECCLFDHSLFFCPLFARPDFHPFQVFFLFSSVSFLIFSR